MLNTDKIFQKTNELYLDKKNPCVKHNFKKIFGLYSNYKHCLQVKHVVHIRIQYFK